MFWRKTVEDSDYKIIEEILISKDISLIKRRGLKFECQYGDWIVIFDMKNLKSSLIKSKDVDYKRKIVEEFIGFKMEALKDKSERKNPAEYIRIVLKRDDEVNGMNSQIPDDLKEEIQIIASPLGEGISMVSVFDSPDKMEFLTSQHVERWGIKKEEIVGVGFENLKKIAENAKFEFLKKDIIQIVSEERHYEATHILISSLRQRLEKELGDTMVFAIPTRDYLFAAKSNDEGAINSLKEISVKAYNNEDYKLTSKILQINEEGEIKEFK